ncbi:hypothetical protein HZB06_01575 [Candidatus Wolfebacteria bacterium]|nr:hypothetical protein [Candidatus Wolfebacteria bacterium]
MSYTDKNKLNKFKLFIFVFLFAVLTFASSTANADLLPCTGLGCAKLGFCGFGMLGKNIIDFMLYTLVMPLAAIMIVYGGIMMMIAGGNESRFASGKSAATSAVIGLVIALLAWLIVDTIIKVITGGSFGPWNKISC